MRTTKLKLAAVVLASAGLLGVAGVGTVLAWPRTVPPPEAAAPAPPEQPIEGDWVPKEPLAPIPTAFPNIKVPVPLGMDLAKLCPHLHGEGVLSIEPTDDTYRRLLKARLHQSVLFVWRFRSRMLQIGHGYQSTDFLNYIRVQNDIRALALELWAADRKNLIPRLEELLLLAKEAERFTDARVAGGNDPPQQLNQAVAYRLEVEAVLWKATHPRPAK
jgi:hypothetical protein